jgi:UTP--glucose-1-phosphate uridylyltransferase
MLWSDAYKITDKYEVIPNMSDNKPLPIIKLDDKFYKFVNQMTERFPEGAPSLKQAKSLTIEGDVLFGKNITILDESKIVNQTQNQTKISDNTIIDSEIYL